MEPLPEVVAMAVHRESVPIKARPRTDGRAPRRQAQVPARPFESVEDAGRAAQAPAEAEPGERAGPLPRSGFYFLSAILMAPAALLFVPLVSMLNQPIQGISGSALFALFALLELFIALFVASLWFRLRISEDPSLEKAWAGRLRILWALFLADMLGLLPALLYSAGDNAGPTVLYVYALIGVPLGIGIIRRRQPRKKGAPISASGGLVP